MRTTLILLAAGSLGLSACSSADGYVGKPGPAVDRSFAVSDFTGVALAGSYRVDIVEGASYAVTARGPEDEIDDMSVKVDGGSLTIGSKKKNSWSLWGNNGNDLVVTVTMPKVEAMSVTGSGDMTNNAPTASRFEATITGSGDLDTGPIRADTVKLKITGSGDMVGRSIAAQETDIGITGSGNIAANGSAGTTHVSVSGSGDVEARDLVASDIEVKVRGSGDVAIGARGKATISVAGSGDVRISGTSDCTISKAGSGDVRCD